jgi:hypothetical protein
MVGNKGCHRFGIILGELSRFLGHALGDLFTAFPGL